MARAALNWTVRDLAEATGLHRNTINNIEVGRYGGDPKTLELIEQTLRPPASSSSTRTVADPAFDFGSRREESAIIESALRPSVAGEKNPHPMIEASAGLREANVIDIWRHSE